MFKFSIIIILVLNSLICFKSSAMGNKTNCIIDGQKVTIKGSIFVKSYMYSKYGFDDRRGYATILKLDKPICYQITSSINNIEEKMVTEIQLFPTIKFRYSKENKKYKVKGVIYNGATLMKSENQSIEPYEKIFCDVVIIAD